LRSSEARYRSIAAQVGAIHLEWDLVSDKVRLDGALDEVLGYQPEDLARMSFHDVSLFVHPDDTMPMRTTLKLARESIGDWQGEYRVRHKDGHYVHLNSRGLFLAGATGKAERMVMAAADITERKNVELRLRDSEERLRIATEQSGRAVYDLNTSTNRVRWAGATQLLFGFSIGEMEKMSWDECLTHLHPRDLHALGEIVARGEDHAVNHREFRVRQRNGTYIYAESISAAQIDEHGRAYRRIGVLSDITARRTAEIERQQYTKQLRTLAEVARNITLFLTVDELVGHLAGAMRDVIGAHQAAISIVASQRSGKAVHCVSLAQKYGRPPDAVPLSDDNLILELLGEHGSTVRLARDQLQAHLAIARIEHYATGEVPLEGLLAARMRARDGTPIGLLRLSAKKRGDFTDSDVQILTQLAGLAAVAIENARLLETLEERVTQRTQDLEVSNRELEAFSYSVSHDLRAPLRAIAGFSQILNDQYSGQLDAQGLRCLERISGGVQKMAELIDDLLGLARVSRAEIRRQRLDLSAMAATIVNRHCERAPERSVEILIDSDMTVQADPRLLEVVLNNLIENAFKFSGKREDASIHIGSAHCDGEPYYFIADNGVGFDPAYANNLFGVFQRLHSVNDFPGTGVGLAIVQRILHRHGGRIWAQSRLDAGATFNFTLAPG
jgi:PAS domain S-box-containing protein